MQLVPSAEDVGRLLRLTGALRLGHFLCPSGLHTNQYLETALVMRHYRHAKTLSVGLSRLIRADSELRALAPELSIVAATPAGLPVAYGLCEALRARQVYWAEKPSAQGAMRFRQYMMPVAGEKVLLVDDILRSGVLLRQARALLESHGATVMAVAVLIHQPSPHCRDFAPLPFYTLARLEPASYVDPADCELCRAGARLERLEAAPMPQVLKAQVTAGAF